MALDRFGDLPRPTGGMPSFLLEVPISIATTVLATPAPPPTMPSRPLFLNLDPILTMTIFPARKPHLTPVTPLSPWTILASIPRRLLTTPITRPLTRSLLRRRRLFQNPTNPPLPHPLILPQQTHILHPAIRQNLRAQLQIIRLGAHQRDPPRPPALPRIQHLPARAAMRRRMPPPLPLDPLLALLELRLRVQQDAADVEQLRDGEFEVARLGGLEVCVAVEGGQPAPGRVGRDGRWWAGVAVRMAAR
uniref:Uncharacterized protein n=1 Tax=Colletotrichum fructicola (strain Nara gc5) TaxID=1213859 RepID=L2FFS8_COLFN